MFRYLLHRLLYTLPVIWLVVSIVFLLIHFVPGDPVQQMLGEGAASADIAATRHAYGLDVPLGRQYLNYWKGVLHGNLGRSLRLNENVSHLIAQRYPYTLQLTLASLFVAIVLAIPAGVTLSAVPARVSRAVTMRRLTSLPRMRKSPKTERTSWNVATQAATPKAKCSGIRRRAGETSLSRCALGEAISAAGGRMAHA